MLKPIKYIILLTLSAVLLSACETPQAPSYPPIRFVDRTPIVLNVAEIDLVNAYLPPLKAPHVDHDFPITPSAATIQWIQDRLQAGGNAGKAVVTIQNAAVTEEPLPQSKGIKGLVTKDQEARYDANVRVRIDVTNAGGLASGFAEASVNRTRSLAEGLSVNERDDAYYALTKELMTAFDAAMSDKIGQHLNDFVVR